MNARVRYLIEPFPSWLAGVSPGHTGTAPLPPKPVRVLVAEPENALATWFA
jgi:hypothetical protein